jgi:hypothetical protein
LGPLERVNLCHWTTHFTLITAIHIPDTRLGSREIKYAVKIAMKQAQPWNMIQMEVNIYVTNLTNKSRP